MGGSTPFGGTETVHAVNGPCERLRAAQFGKQGGYASPKSCCCYADRMRTQRGHFSLTAHQFSLRNSGAGRRRDSSLRKPRIKDRMPGTEALFRVSPRYHAPPASPRSSANSPRTRQVPQACEADKEPTNARNSSALWKIGAAGLREQAMEALNASQHSDIEERLAIQRFHSTRMDDSMPHDARVLMWQAAHRQKHPVQQDRSRSSGQHSGPFHLKSQLDSFHMYLSQRLAPLPSIRSRRMSKPLRSWERPTLAREQTSESSRLSLGESIRETKQKSFQQSKRQTPRGRTLPPFGSTASEADVKADGDLRRNTMRDRLRRSTEMRFFVLAQVGGRASSEAE